MKFFGHCHQRALTGTTSSLQALKLAPGYEVSEIDAGCCGMAGSFGYEKEHVELAMACGEDRLFPAIRGATPETEIAVTGVSCREQIGYGTGRRARHLVEVLANARNLPGHGCSEVARLARATTGWRLDYGDLNTLPDLIEQIWSGDHR